MPPLLAGQAQASRKKSCLAVLAAVLLSLPAPTDAQLLRGRWFSSNKEPGTDASGYGNDLRNTQGVVAHEFTGVVKWGVLARPDPYCVHHYTEGDTLLTSVVTLWVYPAATLSASMQTLLAWVDDAGTSYLQVVVDGTGTSVGVRTHATPDLMSAVALDERAWTYVTASLSQGSFRVTVNGQTSYSSQLPPELAGWSPMSLSITCVAAADASKMDRIAEGPAGNTGIANVEYYTGENPCEGVGGVFYKMSCVGIRTVPCPTGTSPPAIDDRMDDQLYSMLDTRARYKLGIEWDGTLQKWSYPSGLVSWPGKWVSVWCGDAFHDGFEAKCDCVHPDQCPGETGSCAGYDNGVGIGLIRMKCDTVGRLCREKILPPLPNFVFAGYAEGSGNNKCVEVYNAGTESRLLTGVHVDVYYNGASTTGFSMSLSNLSLEPNASHLLCEVGSVVAAQTSAQETTVAGFFSGDDAIVLRDADRILDSIGRIGEKPTRPWDNTAGGSQTPVVLIATQEMTLQRMLSSAPDRDPYDAYQTAGVWTTTSTIDDFTTLGKGPVDDVAAVPATTPTPNPPTDAPPTDAPPTDAPPTNAPPTDAPPTDAPPTDAPPTDAPPTDAPPTNAPPTDAPPTDAPPTDAPPTDAPPTKAPPTDAPPTIAPLTDAPPTDIPTSVPTPVPTSAPTSVPTAVLTASPTSAPTDAPPTNGPATDAPPTDAPPTDAPPTDAPPTDAPPTGAPPTNTPATSAPPTGAPSTDAPRTRAPQTQAPPSDAPGTGTQVTSTPSGHTQHTPVPGVGAVPTLPSTTRPDAIAGSTTELTRTSLASGAATVASIFSPAAGPRLSWLMKVECVVEDFDLNHTATLDWEFHPTGLSIGTHAHRYFLGAIVSNTGIIVAFLALNYSVAVAQMKFLGVSWGTAMFTVRAPGLAYIPLIWLHMGTVLSASNLAFFPSRAPAYAAAVGWAALLVCVGLPFLLWTLLFAPARFCATTVPDPRVDAATAALLASTSTGRLGELSLLKGRAKTAYVFVFGRELWVRRDGAPDFFVEQYGMFFEMYKHGFHWWSMVEMSQTTIFALMAAWKPETFNNCIVRSVLLLVLLVGYFGLIVYLRPHSSAFDSLSAGLESGMTALAVLLISVAIAVGSRSPTFSNALTQCAGVLLLASAVLLLLQGAYAIGLYSSDLLMGRRQTALSPALTGSVAAWTRPQQIQAASGLEAHDLAAFQRDERPPSPVHAPVSDFGWSYRSPSHSLLVRSVGGFRKNSVEVPSASQGSASASNATELSTSLLDVEATGGSSVGSERRTSVLGTLTYV